MYQYREKLKWFGRLSLLWTLVAAIVGFTGLAGGQTASAMGNPPVPGHVFLQYGHYTGISLEGVVYTDNLNGSGTTDKTVVSYRLNNGSWHGVLASRVGAVTGNQTAWKYNIALSGIDNSSSIRIDFEAFYDVGSTSYVDNNNGNYYTVGNYVAQLPMWNLMRSGVQLASSEFYKNNAPDTSYSLNASAVTKNIGSPQKVQILYTTNNWVTQKAVDPYGSSSLNNSGGAITQWKFHADVDSNNVRFKVVFTTVIYLFGSPIALTYTDSNLGSDYTKSVP